MKPLLCTIYKASREKELYLYVTHGDDLSRVPADLLARMGELKEVMTIKLSAKRELAHVRASEVLNSISEKGYFLQLPPKLDPVIFTYGE